MNDGKHCPACGKDIGVWPVLTAGLPAWVRCPYCKARLTYGTNLLLLLGVVAMAALAAVVSYQVALQLLSASSRNANPSTFYGVASGVFLALWIPIELVFTLYMRRFGVLRKRE